MIYELTIQRLKNGYLLHTKVGDEHEVESDSFVIEEEEDPLEAPQDLLWEVMDFFGPFDSKHDPERLVVKREKNEH